MRWWWTLLLVIASRGPGGTEAKKEAAAPQPKEPVIEDITAKQFERILNDKDFVAVFWCEYT
jgi:hypothetical protein